MSAVAVLYFGLTSQKDVPDLNKILRLNCAVSLNNRDIGKTRGASSRTLSGSRYFSISKNYLLFLPFNSAKIVLFPRKNDRIIWVTASVSGS